MRGVRLPAWHQGDVARRCIARGGVIKLRERGVIQGQNSGKVLSLEMGAGPMERRQSLQSRCGSKRLRNARVR